MNVSVFACVCHGCIYVKLVSYLHYRAPQCHVLSMRLKVLCVRVCVDVMTRVCVRMVCVQHCSLWWVQGAGHRGEGVGARIPCHLTPGGRKMRKIHGESIINSIWISALTYLHILYVYICVYICIYLFIFSSYIFVFCSMFLVV